MLDRYFPLYAVVFLLTAATTFLLEKRLIPTFSSIARQPIYEGGPKWHVKKSGTPTMGGIAFVIATSVSFTMAGAIIGIKKASPQILSLTVCQIYALLNSAVGVIDDAVKLRHKENQGLHAKTKLLFQTILSALFLFIRHGLFGSETSLSFSFGNIELGFLYYPIAMIILVGIVNCANLTDGIDGLASSVAFSIGVSLLYISAALNVEASIIASAIIGASIGFLTVNLHPAKIFMGDTGSLYLGALIASSAFALNNPLLIVFVAGVYVIEGISVILQVLFYKLTKRRIFKMAPLHHHFEKCGWSENRICIVAILLTFLFSIPAYIFYLP